MDTNTITINEVQNDAKTIHLYYHSLVGLYIAYGFSAYLAAHLVSATNSFSEDMQMPVALLRKDAVSRLKLSVDKLQHDYHSYYKLELRKPIDLEDYGRWARMLRWDNQERDSTEELT